jgi:DNA polymerase III subunit beta
MFAITVNKEQLLAALLIVSGAIDKKHDDTILSHIALRCSGNDLVVSATDLEIEITGKITCEAQNKDTAITVPAKKIIEIIKSLEDGAKPKITYDHNMVVIADRASKFKLASLDIQQYPSVTHSSGNFSINIARLSLLRALDLTIFSVAQNDVRFFLNCLFIEINKQGLTCVGSDGHRIAIYKLELNLNCDAQKILIPRKGILEMFRLLQHVSDSEITLEAGKNHIKIITQDYMFSSKLTDAKFPPYTNMLQNKYDKHISIDRDLLKRALLRMIILTNEKYRAVILHKEEQQITLSANNQAKEQEEAVETLTAQTSGGTLKIGINAAYILDILGHIEAGYIDIAFYDKDSSILITSKSDANFQYIIMPMIV